MPELPEVEILVRHLRPLLRNKVVQGVQVRRAKVLKPTSPRKLAGTLRGATFIGLRRRGKYLVFTLRAARTRATLTLIGHLGMTGRMYLLPKTGPIPKHAAVVLGLARQNFVFEDTRYFGRLTLDATPLARLGPEPLDDEFTIELLLERLASSGQAVKLKLLDQALVAGIGNIYASEVLFRAGISPGLPARRLKKQQVSKLWSAIREVLAEAIACGSTVPLDYAGTRTRDRHFYYGRAAGAEDYYEERLRVYDRANQPCPTCATTIRRFVQGARSTFYCPKCQRP
jgi:formamidopyrimidine-DNA glycosylase